MYSHNVIASQGDENIMTLADPTGADLNCSRGAKWCFFITLKPLFSVAIIELLIAYQNTLTLDRLFK